MTYLSIVLSPKSCFINFVFRFSGHFESDLSDSGAVRWSSTPIRPTHQRALPGCAESTVDNNSYQWVTLGTNFATGGATTDSVLAGRSGRAGGALSSIEAERMVGSGRHQAHSMRQSAGTTMVCVTWRHVSRSTCHRVNPYENKRWGKIFEGEIAETPNLQVKCALVWNT